MTVESILFDMGNVLIFHDNALLVRRLAERAGADPRALARQLQEQVWPRTDRGELPPGALHRELCGWLGVELAPEEFRELWSCHFAVNEPMVAQVEALVGRVRLLLLSNTNELHARHCLERLPVLQRFDALFFSHEVGRVKPDPAIFAHALVRAGTAPAATAFFDDNPANVEAARAVGIRAELFESAAAFPAQLRALGLAS